MYNLLHEDTQFRSMLMSHGKDDGKTTANDKNEKFHGAELPIFVMRLHLRQDMHRGNEEKRAGTEQHRQAGGINRVSVTNSLEEEHCVV